MGKIQFTDEAWEDIVKWIGEDRKKSKKIFALLEDIKTQRLSRNRKT